MAAVSSCRIVWFGATSSVEEAYAVLTKSGYDVDVHPFNGPHRRLPGQLIVVDGGAETNLALEVCRRLHEEHRADYTPILFLTPGQDVSARLASLQSGADASVSRPINAAELLAHVQTLLRGKERHDRLALKAAEAERISQRLQSANQQIDQELELARRLQESFLPQSLPQLPRVRFAVKYKPFARVGGDFYDAFRLDEKHVGFYVADAMGHGIPASLLTIFIKKGVRAKEITGDSYSLVPPTEVLHKLNRDLIAQRMPDLPFITMVYVLFNHMDGTLQYSRAGHPHPLLIPRDGHPALSQLEGGLLGVFDNRYRLQTHHLKPGDKFVLYTDGMDGASFGQHTVGGASLLAAAEEFRALPIDEFIDRLSSDLFIQTQIRDDLTVFGMEVVE